MSSNVKYKSICKWHVNKSSFSGHWYSIFCQLRCQCGSFIYQVIRRCFSDSKWHLSDTPLLPELCRRRPAPGFPPSWIHWWRSDPTGWLQQCWPAGWRSGRVGQRRGQCPAPPPSDPECMAHTHSCPGHGMSWSCECMVEGMEIGGGARKMDQLLQGFHCCCIAVKYWKASTITDTQSGIERRVQTNIQTSRIYSTYFSISLNVKARRLLKIGGTEFKIMVVHWNWVCGFCKSQVIHLKCS